MRILLHIVASTITCKITLDPTQISVENCGKRLSIRKYKVHENKITINIIMFSIQ